LYESVLETLDVGDGTTLLDVGCGAGMFCLLAANRGAEVCGFDASAELLEIARGRAPAGDFRQGDAECLPYPNGIFDLVTGFDSFRYTAVPTSALREARRVSKSGAPVVVAVWGDESDCEASAIFDALAALATTRPETFAPAALDGLAELVERAGLEPERVEDVRCEWRYADLDLATRGLLSGGAATTAIEAAGERAVRQAIADALGPFRDDTGAYVLRNVFRYLVARS
jgi:SAM-dependent methyltransferase